MSLPAKTIATEYKPDGNTERKYSEEEILALVRKQDKAGLELLYTNFSPLLLGVISNIIKPKEEAEQLLCDTFLNIAQNIHQYNASTGRLISWMMRIARSLALEKLNSRQSADNFKNNSGIKDTSEINPSLKLLDATPRLLLDLIVLKGYSHTEIATLYGLSPEDIKQNIHIAMKNLRVA